MERGGQRKAFTAGLAAATRAVWGSGKNCRAGYLGRSALPHLGVWVQGRGSRRKDFTISPAAATRSRVKEQPRQRTPPQLPSQR